MSAIKDLSGQKFGRLTVLSEYERRTIKPGDTRTYWKCKCDCGTVKFIPAIHLQSGRTVSCGCQRADSCRKNASLRKRKLNKYDLTSKPYGIGYCTNDNSEFYFDLEDYDKIKDYSWSHHNGYIVTSIKSVPVFIQTIIMPPPHDLHTSHIHGKESAYDNRKSNLRFCNKSMVLWNMPIRPNNTTGVTGVYHNKKLDMWVAQLTHNKKIESRRFKTKEEAIAQRKEWEEKFFGVFSRDNSQAVELD